MAFHLILVKEELISVLEVIESLRCGTSDIDPLAMLRIGCAFSFNSNICEHFSIALNHNIASNTYVIVALKIKNNSN